MSHMNNLPRQIIFLLVFLSIAYSYVQVSLNSQNEVVSDTSDAVWMFVYAIFGRASGLCLHRGVAH